MKAPNRFHPHTRMSAHSLSIITTIIFTLFAGTLALAQNVGESTKVSGKKAASIMNEEANAPVKTAQAPGVKSRNTIAADIPERSLVTTTSYPFSTATSVALEDMSSGTTTLVAAGSDDGSSVLTNIGFDFWYDGVRFSQFAANANGFARLGAVPAAASIWDNSANFATTNDSPKIAPYYDDIWVGTNGKVHFKTIGSAPNRKLIVEWQNMTIPRAGAATTGAGTFQMWLFETTGVIEFVYGSGIIINSANAGYSIGLQSGAATNFASVTTSTNTVSYAAANNTQTGAIASGRAYVFTPNAPAAPTGLSFTNVNATTLTLNWTDNATNEVGNAIYQSNDGGTNYFFVTQSAANATSQAVSGLNPSTTYFFKVFAVTEGGVSSSLDGSQATSAAGNITSAASGNWGDTTTWTGGVVPTANDNVTIQNGHTVTINSSNALSVTVQSGGILQFELTTARTLTVGQFVTIDSGGIFQSNPAGTQTGHVLSVGTNLTNNGTLDFSTNTNTAGANITFTGAANNTFGGTGGTTDIRTLTINKGTSNANVLELNPTNFTVQGGSTDGTPMAFLTLTNGTLKVSGTFTLTGRVFTAAAYTIGATTGFWLNNPNFIVAGQAGSPTENGLLRISQGTFNVGTSSGNSMTPGAGATITIEGGAMNVTGRLSSTANSGINYTQSGGTLTVNTVGNASSNNPSFGFEVGTNFTMSGGTIILQLRSTAATPLDYSMFGTFNVTGGTLQVGNASTLASSSFVMRGGAPTMVVDNSTAGRAALINGINSLSIFGNLTLNAGTTLSQTSSGSVLMNGNTNQPGNVVNNGTISNASATGSNRVQFFGATGQQSYSGSGTFGSAVTPYAGVGISNVNGVNISSPMTLTRINLFNGAVTGANNLTFGNGGASSTLIQISQAGGTTPGGTLDAAPTYNTGSGGHTVLYLQESVARTTGFEIPSSRIIANATVDNTNGVSMSGNLSVTTLLTLTFGNFNIGANTLTLAAPISGTATNLQGGATSSLVFNGTTAINIPSSITQLNNFTLNNTGGSTLQVSTTTINGTLTLSNGVLTIGARTLNLNGPISVGTGSLTGGATSLIAIGGSGAQVTLPAVSGGLFALTVNRNGGVLLGAPLSIAASGFLGLINGPLDNSTNNVTLGNLVDLRRDVGSISVAPVFSGLIDLEYQGATAVTTGPEVPTNPATVHIFLMGFPGTTLGSNVTVNLQLSLQGGNITTGNNVLTLAAGATVNRSSGYVDGNFARVFQSAAPFTYDLGAGGFYSPATVSPTAGTFPTTLTVKALNSQIAGLTPAQSLQRSWVFSSSAITKATLTFSYDSADVPGLANTALFRVVRKLPTDQRFTFPNGATDNVNEGINTASATSTTMPALGGGLYSITQSNAPGVKLGDARPVELFDFDGNDARTDVAVWNGTTGDWTIINSVTDTQRVFSWGRTSLGDILTPGDYDGDGRTDIAVWRSTDGNWYVIKSSDDTGFATGWGTSGDVPVPGDYDGDGKTDIAVYRPSEGNWYIINSSTNALTQRQWGNSTDNPVPADYDGDGKTDIAVYRPSEGNWYVVKSSDNTLLFKSWGASGDRLVPGDYDGDGKADFAVWRPTEGNWYVVNSSDGSASVQSWGTSGDFLVPGDYDRDGRIDIAVWRPSDGNFYIIRSSDGSVTTYLGNANTVPVITVP